MVQRQALIVDRALTMDVTQPMISPAYLAWDGEVLTDVRPANRSDFERPSTRVLPDSVALPGFINAHHHVASALLTGIENQGIPGLKATGTTDRAELARAMGPFAETAAALGYLELARAGVTTTTDSQAAWRSDRRVDGSLRAARSSGLRVHFSVAFIDRTELIPEEEQFTAPEARQELERIRGLYACDRVEVEGEPLSLPRASDELIRAMHQARHRLAALHLTYSRAFERWADEELGRRAVEHLDHLGVLDDGWLFAHPIHLDAREIRSLAEAGSAVCYCPVSNLHMGLETPDLRQLRTAGVPIALGLDHPNGSHDVLQNAKVAVLAQRSVAGDATAWTALDALEALTRGGGAALGFTDIGVLREGWAADIVVLDGLGVLPPDAERLADQIVMSGAREHVAQVIAAGRSLVTDHALVATDGPAIRAAAADARRHLLARHAPSTSAHTHDPPT